MFNLKIKTGNIIVEAKHKKTMLEFDVSSIVTARNLKDVNKQNIFYVLNRYLDYKGDSFKDELMKRLEQSNNELFMYLGMNDGLNLPLQIVHRILDMFDVNDIFNFLKENNIIKVPDRLSEEYDETIEINDQGSREQTFTISDYLELVALITALKATLGIIGAYAGLYSGIINNKYKEYLLLDFYITHPISETRPFLKLRAYVKKLVDIAATNTEEFKKQLIEKAISEEELEKYIVGIVIFQKLIIADEVEDVNNKNIITKLYNTVKHRLKIKTQDNSKIRLKHTGPTNVANDNESESVMESYRVPTDITIGFREEFNFYYSQPFMMADNLGVENFELLEYVLPTFQLLIDKEIPEMNVYLMSWILKHIIDPRAVEYITIDNVANGLAVAFTWLYENNFKDIALLLSAFEIKNNNFQMNTTVRNKLRPELKEELDKLFPYHKVVSNKDEVKHESLIVEIINKYINDMSEKNLMSILDDETINNMTGSYNKLVSLRSDIRNRITELIIHVEKYGSKKLKKNLQS